MDSLIEKFQVKENYNLLIDDLDPAFTGDLNKDDGEEILMRQKAELKDLQEKLYVSQDHSLLIILQAMDGGGKDSAIEHVMGGVNPQGCIVHNFKQPTIDELRHDFLWRHAKAAPKRGMIGIHNRSHYENVLVTKVHPELILNEDIARYSKLDDLNEKFWKERYDSIRNFEKHLYLNGTVILKFFLHISRDEQKERFLKRIEEPDKNWKFSYGDIHERSYWKDYMKAYEAAISETSVEHAPWYIIPADKKWFARIAIISIIVDKLKDLSLTLPTLSEQERQDLERGKKELLEEKK